MKLEIQNPTKALIKEATESEIELLRSMLTYTNTANAHLLKRHSQNRWFMINNRPAWDARYEEIRKTVKQTLVFEENGQLFIRPGSIPYIADALKLEIENKIEYPEIKKVPWSKVLPFELHPYQQESVEKLIEVKHGAVSIATGGGKTAIILKLLRELGLQSVVVVPSASIFNEMLHNMENHLGKGMVGAYGNGKKKLGKKFTIAISDSLVNLEKGTEAYDFFAKQQVFIGDECFPYRTKILTDKGSSEIGKIYKRFKNNEQVNVLSFNEHTKTFEYKRVINAWKKDPQNVLLNIKCSGMNFKCTPNHKLLTERGWKAAEDLAIGELLVGYRGLGKRSSVAITLNSDQEQIILGSYLGDGHISKHKNGYRCTIIHSDTQKEYLKWKAFMFNQTNVETIEKNGYAQKPALRFNTVLFNSDINFSSKKGDGLSEVLDKLDERGLAIWAMDDGSSDRGRFRLHTENFAYSSQQMMAKSLEVKWNLRPKILKYKKNNKTYFYLSFGVRDTEFLNLLVKEYFHENLYYKLLKEPTKYYVWNNKYEKVGLSTVLDIVRFYPKKYKNYNNNLFDLEVENNHNFVVGTNSGIVAHNCHTLPSETLEKVCHGLLSEVPYRFTMSGTHARGDGSKALLQSITGPIVNSLGTKEAIEGGYICPHRYRIIELESSNPNLMVADVLEMKRIHFLRNKNIGAFIAKLAKIEATTYRRQTLVLVEELSQISMLIKLLKDEGIPIAYAHSESKKERLEELGLEKVDPAESVEKFNKGEAMILIGTSCIATGTNIYPVHNCINWVGGTSEIKTKQGAVGRSVRLGNQNKWHDKCTEKKEAIIYDFNVQDIYLMTKHLEDRLEFYKESGTEIKFIKLK